MCVEGNGPPPSNHHETMTKTTTNSNPFTVGTTYVMGFIGDADQTCDWLCTKVTASFATFTSHFGTKRCKVLDGGYGPHVLPLGRYSMAPILRPDRIKSDLA